MCKQFFYISKILLLICFLTCTVIVEAQIHVSNRTKPFDADWRFIKDSTIAADAPGYDDSKWRTVDLPHDWSIEDLPNQTPDSIIGPFSNNCIGGRLPVMLLEAQVVTERNSILITK